MKPAAPRAVRARWFRRRLGQLAAAVVRPWARHRRAAAARAERAARLAECERRGHVEAGHCACPRCGAPLHHYQPVRQSRVALRSELVNPNADPGALYLSADFQPDWDYGLRQTVYETTTVRRCERCGAEDVVRTLEAEIDE